MVQKRDVAIAIILTIVTCGIYGIYWFIMLTNEVKAASGDDKLASGGLAFVFTLLSCGIYGIYWAYKMGKLIESAQSANKLTPKDNSVLYLVLELFGLGIVDYCLMQNDLNEITRAKNGGAQAQ